jgi:DNA-binding ferritin-like protein
MLAANEMASAVAKATALADLPDAARLATAPDLAKALAADQDAIIAVLRRILDITGKLADAVREDQKRLEPSDLPPDTLDKLKGLRDRLKDFVKEQKKVIEASQELAKKPVDAFNDEDQKKLDKIGAIEDQWDKFLTEAIAECMVPPGYRRR